MAFFVTAVGLDETGRGTDGFKAVAEVLTFRLALRAKSSLVFFFDPIDFGLDDVFERLPEKFSSFFGDGGIGIVQELSERGVFACALDGSIVIQGLGEKVDFAFGLSDDGRTRFGPTIRTCQDNNGGKEKTVCRLFYLNAPIAQLGVDAPGSLGCIKIAIPTLPT